jgi:4-amino-4-deoxy-L-arabinose transferase-like glycosyltransferase
VSSGTWKWLIAVPATFFLFFFALTDVGLLGPDEPRYASIGREMAQSGDWVTPRLWDEPWFEKPALLYWMIAFANQVGLGDELAPRLPVSLLSVLFLYFYYRLLRSEFGGRAALFATVVLGTSAGWLAFSHLGVTDLPMAVTFSAAMLLGLRWFSTGEQRWLVGAAVLLGLAVLAKGLVPLVLALPLVWMGRARLRQCFRPLPLAAFFIVAAPWYVLCTLHNGSAFLEEFFWKHHFTRFSTGALLHEQPFWFYVPVLLAGLFPWTPLLVLLFKKSFYSDSRRRFFLLWVLFGLVFFSVSANKLPGYLLPLFPATAALLGVALAEARDARWVLAVTCLLLLLIPLISESLPRILMAGGISRAKMGGWHWGFAITYVLLAVIVWWAEEIGRRESALGILLLAVVLSVTYVKVRSFSSLDRLASGRPAWRRISTQTSSVCVDSLHRNWRYSLNYYSVTPLPDCAELLRPIRVQQLPGLPPFVH